MNYTNSPLEVPVLIQTLKDRGLSITDDDKTLAFLENVSYFRFRTYLRPMEQDTVTHQYKSGASFDKAVSLYQFDAQLKALVFSAIQQIEISLRAKIINQFSLSHGAFWFMLPESATDKHKFTENLSTLERELQRSKDDFIKEHYAKYDKEGYPPAWKMLELVSKSLLQKFPNVDTAAMGFTANWKEDPFWL